MKHGKVGLNQISKWKIWKSDNQQKGKWQLLCILNDFIEFLLVVIHLFSSDQSGWCDFLQGGGGKPRRQKQSSPSHSSPQDVSSVLLVTLSVASVGVFEVPYPLSSKADPTYLHPVQHPRNCCFLNRDIGIYQPSEIRRHRFQHSKKNTRSWTHPTASAQTRRHMSGGCYQLHLLCDQR